MAGRLYLVDERGAVIDEFGPQYANLDLPIVDGFGTTGDRQDGTNANATPTRLVRRRRRAWSWR